MVDAQRRRLLRLGLTAAATAAGGGWLAWSRLQEHENEVASSGAQRRGTTSTARSSTSSSASPTSTPSTSTTSEPPTPSTSSTAAPAQAVVLPVLCRDAWRAAPAGEPLPRHAISGVMVHHTAVVSTSASEAPARLRSHQNHHQSRGFRDLAYHLTVDLAGNVYEGRDPEQPGETFTEYDPTGWFLVTCEGNFDEQPLSDAQLEGLARAAAWAVAAYGLAPDAVRAHRDVSQTACPGRAVYDRFADGSLLGRVADLTGHVERADVCGAEGRARVAAIESGAA